MHAMQAWIIILSRSVPGIRDGRPQIRASFDTLGMRSELHTQVLSAEINQANEALHQDAAFIDV